MSANVFSNLDLKEFRIYKTSYLVRKSELYILAFFSFIVVLIGFIAASVNKGMYGDIYQQDYFFTYGVNLGIIYIVLGIASLFFTRRDFISYYLTTSVPLYLFFYNQYRMCVILNFHQYTFSMFLSFVLFIASAYFAGTLIHKK